MTVGGVARTYVMDGPTSGGPYPLILFLHGLDGTGQGAEQASHLGNIARQAGFIAVFPDGLAKQWNHYPPGHVTEAAQRRAQAAGTIVPDDEAFLKAIIADFVGRHLADAQHVYLGGMSNGTFMALRMLCDDAGQFAALALISDGMPIPTGAGCHPAKPIPVLIEKGTADDHIPYAGGLILDHEFSVWSADRLNGFFAALDGCTPNPTTNENFPNGGKFKIDHLEWTDCKAGPIEFYRINGGPHVLFQFPPPAITLWNFFKRYSL
jgi:polyhydroxybutyrate depolymerase